jgi:hypothetical protein
VPLFCDFDAWTVSGWLRGLGFDVRQTPVQLVCPEHPPIAWPYLEGDDAVWFTQLEQADKEEALSVALAAEDLSNFEASSVDNVFLQFLSFWRSFAWRVEPDEVIAAARTLARGLGAYHARKRLEAWFPAAFPKAMGYEDMVVRIAGRRLGINDDSRLDGALSPLSRCGKALCFSKTWTDALVDLVVVVLGQEHFLHEQVEPMLWVLRHLYLSASPRA